MPRIHKCFLNSVETNYNPSTNIYFDNGAPVEIDMSVTYQETRALTRDDIETMETELNNGMSMGTRGKQLPIEPMIQKDPLVPEVKDGFFKKAFGAAAKAGAFAAMNLTPAGQALQAAQRAQQAQNFIDNNLP